MDKREYIKKLWNANTAIDISNILDDFENEIKNSVVLADVRLCDTCNKREGFASKVFNGYYCDGCYDKQLNEA